MSGFRNPLHGRTHRRTGSDPIPGLAEAVAITDGATTIDPATTLTIADRLHLADLGAGNAELSGPVLSPCRYVSMNCRVDVLGDGTPAFPDWRGSQPSDASCFTNDVVGETAYGTPGGALLAGDFTGDNFNTTAMQNASDAVGINDGSPGVYFYWFGWSFFKPGGSPFPPGTTWIAALTWIASNASFNPLGMVPFNSANGYGHPTAFDFTGSPVGQRWGPVNTGPLIKLPQGTSGAVADDSLGFSIAQDSGATYKAAAVVTIVKFTPPDLV